jgi:hypothetical protein
MGVFQRGVNSIISAAIVRVSIPHILKQSPIAKTSCAGHISVHTCIGLVSANAATLIQQSIRIIGAGNPNIAGSANSSCVNKERGHEMV